MNEKTKVVIVDDEMISRGYMELFIKPARNYEVIASLPLAGDAIRYCRENTPPDLLIMDVMMASGIDGLSAAARIKQECPQVKIIITTSMADTDWLTEAKEAGIESFWFKTYPEMSLLDVMDRTMAGESVYPGSPPELKLGKISASDLTPQQRNVLRLLTEGLSNREIAEKLYVSPNTVKTHLDEIMEKADIHSRTALVARAARLGIVVSDTDRMKGHSL